MEVGIVEPELLLLEELEPDELPELLLEELEPDELDPDELPELLLEELDLDELPDELLLLLVELDPDDPVPEVPSTSPDESALPEPPPQPGSMRASNNATVQVLSALAMMGTVLDDGRSHAGMSALTPD